MAWDRDKRREWVGMAWPHNETPLDVGTLKNRSGADGEWIRLVGDYGAGYFVSEPAGETRLEERVGMVSADEWDPDANPFG
jgi:hypothetical protein